MDFSEIGALVKKLGVPFWIFLACILGLFAIKVKVLRRIAQPKNSQENSKTREENPKEE
jgi:hypothetical protein